MAPRSQHDFRRGSEQWEYLASDLRSVNRTRTPWLVFSGHRPMYVDSTNWAVPDGDQPVARLLRDNLEDLLMAAKVDFAWWGHHHSSQRTCPVYRERCVDAQDASDGYRAPVHLIIGMAGAGLSQNTAPARPDWLDFVDVDVHGYLRVVVNATVFAVDYVNVADGRVYESFALRRGGVGGGVGGRV